MKKLKRKKGDPYSLSEMPSRKMLEDFLRSFGGEEVKVRYYPYEGKFKYD